MFYLPPRISDTRRYLYIPDPTDGVQSGRCNCFTVSMKSLKASIVYSRLPRSSVLLGHYSNLFVVIVSRQPIESNAGSHRVPENRQVSCFKIPMDPLCRYVTTPSALWIRHYGSSKVRAIWHCCTGTRRRQCLLALRMSEEENSRTSDRKQPILYTVIFGDGSS